MKLDLHTHCAEATYTPLPKLIDRYAVEKIVTAVKRKGLDGIGVTDHYKVEFGLEIKRIVAEHFDNQILIIPGREVFSQGYHLVELFLPDDIVFRFLPHPIYDERLEKSYDFSKLHGIEIENYSYSDHIDKARVRALAEKYNLMLLSNSDAHELNDIGAYYNELDIEDLVNRVKLSSNSESNIPTPRV